MKEFIARILGITKPKEEPIVEELVSAEIPEEITDPEDLAEADFYYKLGMGLKDIDVDKDLRAEAEDLLVSYLPYKVETKLINKLIAAIDEDYKKFFYEAGLIVGKPDLDKLPNNPDSHLLKMAYLIVNSLRFGGLVQEYAFAEMEVEAKLVQYRLGMLVNHIFSDKSFFHINDGKKTVEYRPKFAAVLKEFAFLQIKLANLVFVSLNKLNKAQILSAEDVLLKGIVGITAEERKSLVSEINTLKKKYF